jgi:two-component system, cell cycle sensor histidine kinase and response regulator CckA
LGVSRDITERKRMQDALRKTEEKFSLAFQTSPAAITIADLATGSYLEVNEAFEQITGYRRDEIIGRSWDALGLWSDPSNRDEAVRRLQASGSLRNWEFVFRKKSGDMGNGLISAELIEIDGKPCAITASIDVTERVQLEGRLRQAQRLESIGRLAGGVAHDFNNLLTVITGYAEFLLQGIAPTDPLRPNLEEIATAAERATSLTRQLLAFSRKQLISLRVMDLNTTIKESVPMLQRLIAEDIAFITELDSSLGQVMADPEQIHQVIMNLVVNARDAMPDGGTIAIGTMNADVSEHDVFIHPDARPGRYVMMMVTDTGEGMDEQTREHLFEPFFTTKEVGKGTGLGLATVYGIIRQSGGWIDVSSELGVGTSMKLYLPRIDGRPTEEEREISGENEFIGSETILLVEDQDAVRRLVKAILKRYGYQILEAANGDEALEIAKEYSGEIHLLLTDVVLPGINGKELSERLKTVCPELRVLFTSGYSSDVITHRGVLDYGVAYIPKPFNPEKLAAKVREILAEPPAPQ